jgi:hypothetical protein
MEVPKTGSPKPAAPAPDAGPAAKAPQADRTDAPAAPRNEAVVKRWDAKEVPAKMTGATAFDAKSGAGAPAAAAAVAPAGPGVPRPGSYPTAGDIDRIASMQDPAARNLEITQAYHDLSKAMGQVVGSENANWSTFATWASKQAGVSIRGEDVPKAMNDAIRGVAGFQDKVDGVNQWLRRVGLPEIPDLPGRLAQKMVGAMDQVKDAIGDGNQRVFEEIGREFSTYIDTFKGDKAYDQAKVDRYLQHFQPGQEKLRDAFAAYAKAQFEKDPNKKSELMLRANGLIGAHEQTRLQGDIVRALNAPADNVIKPAIKKVIREAMEGAGPFGSGKWLYDRLDKAGLVDKAIAPLVNAASSAFRQVATDYMMQLQTPTQNLKLGSDVPGQFQQHLRTIEDPALQKLLNQVDRTPNTTQGSGARDWSSYGDRMNYIIDLFRVNQSDPSLFQPPFPGRSGNYTGAPRVS